MIKFLAKKSFYDFLDHFFCMLLLNAGFLIVLIVSLAISSVVVFIFQDKAVVLIPAAAALVIFILTVYTGGAAGIVYAITEKKPVSFREFGHCLKSSLKNSLLLALTHCLFLFLFFNALFFYTGVKFMVGPLAASLLFWLGLLWYTAVQFFFAIHYRLEKRFFKIFKMMFVFFLDNQLFSLGLLLASILLALLTIPTLLLIPGYAFLLLLTGLGLKFRLYKYTYLKNRAAEQPNNTRRNKIPWHNLLADELEPLAKRTLLNTFFPKSTGKNLL